MQIETAHNYEALQHNPYPGRGIVVGMDESGRLMVQVYWIMGRSANSRNRIFESEWGELRTAAADPTKVKDPSLIIYNAMRELKDVYIVSNGDQTDTIYQGLLAGVSFSQALNTRQYEPDAPNYTPRISAICSLREGVPVAEMSILKRSPFGEACDRQTFRYEFFAPGIGRCVTTYEGDGDPLPPFRGEPLLMPLAGEGEDIARNYWDALDLENRVALAVKTIDIANGTSDIMIINQYGESE
ncbi:MAG: IMP cyclohydrolase [bacterium]|nr:IMP cyclohydrolase [bacterium]